MILLLVFTLMTAPAHAGWWSDFCERHLVAEDPYQYEHLSHEKLVDVYYRHKLTGRKSKALIYEIWKRLQDESLNDYEREILSETIWREE